MMAVAPPPVPFWHHVTCQGHDGPCDVCWRLGRGVLGSWGPFLAPGQIVCIIAIPPLVAPTFRADQLPTDGLDLVVGKVLVDGLLTTLCCALATWALPLQAAGSLR